MRSDTLRAVRRCRSSPTLLACAMSVSALAQVPQPGPPSPALGLPQSQPLPPPIQPAPLSAQPTAFDPNNPPGASPRFLFAGALALVVKSVGSTVVSSLGQGITNWFNTKAGQLGGPQPGTTPWMPPPMAGAVPPGAAPWMPPPPTAGTAPVTGGYGVPPAGMPQVPPGATPGSMPGVMPPGMTPAPTASADAFPAAAPMGAVPMMAAPTPGTPAMPTPMAATSAPALYAGLAFEVHLVGPGGSETTVDPGTYVFHSGERFLVYYRPSLPGRVHVFNVSPVGEVIPIETLTLAGGELAKLGPYQLTEPAGDEALRLVLEPCSSPELVAATRNIVKATDTGSGSDLHLGACQASTAPAAGVGTRNIVKATMDGNTGFALDPVSSKELATGHLASREATIAIHHR
jgi:hypothetical protein